MGVLIACCFPIALIFFFRPHSQVRLKVFVSVVSVIPFGCIVLTYFSLFSWVSYHALENSFDLVVFEGSVSVRCCPPSIVGACTPSELIGSTPGELLWVCRTWVRGAILRPPAWWVYSMFDGHRFYQSQPLPHSI